MTNPVPETLTQHVHLMAEAATFYNTSWKIQDWVLRAIYDELTNSGYPRVQATVYLALATELR